MTSHPLLRAFQSSTPAFGAWLALPGAHHARLIAQASPHLAWIVIDCEHGLTALQPGAAESVAAIAGAGVSPLVRIPATGPSGPGGVAWQVKYALDAGARGVLVPMINNAAQAALVASEARFPPRGVRGFGSPFTHGIWGTSAGEYLAGANDSVLVIVQIESREAVENVEAIAAVEGVDALFIGPFDLSISLGYPTPAPEPHPEVEKVMQRILEVGHAAGKKVGTLCVTGPQAAERAKQGFDMVNVTVDTSLLTSGIATELAAAAGQ
ncbi:Phosphoenolpyruvate/pyruvate domain-containing protein [Dentipellis sp. KUC8613]|nr:Phosphoenolpyruvate/pyruvate domain-containing protein [Dentipellis sp. KUC8613]